MCGTDRFCRNPAALAAMLVLLVSTGAAAQTRLMNAPPDGLDNEFQRAIADELPPSQYGGYQYVGPFPRSRYDRGFQFADAPAQDAANSADENAPLAPDWGHADIHQIQYPLSDQDFEAIEERLPPAVPDPHWAPPLLTAPVHAPAAGDPGWGLQAQFPCDFTWVIGRGNTLGFTTLAVRAVVETPRLPGVSLRPHFGWHFLSGPRRTDLPEQLYDFSFEGRMYWPFGERLISEFALAPSLFTDFENTSSDAIRIIGRVVGYYLWSENVRLAGGGTYLDRQDILFLPIAGVIWTPTPDHRLELVFPQPRIAHRYRHDADHERWVYLSGELGGGSWAIRRRSGRDDIVSYRDLRLMTGVEYKYADKSSWRIEGGFVFDREVEYVSNLGNYKPGNTTMIRAAIVF